MQDGSGVGTLLADPAFCGEPLEELGSSAEHGVERGKRQRLAEATGASQKEASCLRSQFQQPGRLVNVEHVVLSELGKALNADGQNFHGDTSQEKSRWRQIGGLFFGGSLPSAAEASILASRCVALILQGGERTRNASSCFTVHDFHSGGIHGPVIGMRTRLAPDGMLIRAFGPKGGGGAGHIQRQSLLRVSGRRGCPKVWRQYSPLASFLPAGGHAGVSLSRRPLPLGCVLDPDPARCTCGFA